MSTEKQVLANQLNAQLSTGPKTAEGKATIATNAIKHGIFTKDLIVTSTLGKENEEEYLEMLNNLVDCLTPKNQMESLLIEKIAIDYWRLRRVIRFETGSIGKYLETIFQEFYSYSRKSNDAIEIEIQKNTQYIDWIASYVECLKKDEVSFDKPNWEGEEIESNVLEDFYLIVKTLESLTYKEKEQLLYGGSNFAELKTVLAKKGYCSNKEISAKLLEVYAQQTLRLKREIEEQEQKRLDNIEADKLNSMLGMIPEEDNTEKILKYERSIQKSIFQNLFLLKKLQGSF